MCVLAVPCRAQAMPCHEPCDCDKGRTVLCYAMLTAVLAAVLFLRVPQVLYGATDLLSGEEFLHQLEELGRRSGITPAAPAPAAAAAAAGGPTG